MLYELRTTSRGGGTGDLQRALGKAGVFGVFQTEVGETGRTVIVQPHTELDLHGAPVVRSDRRDARGADLFGKHELELLSPAPFMAALEPCKLGNVWELRWFDYAPGAMDEALGAFGAAMPHRQELYPVVGCWREETGPHADRLYLLAPFKDWDHYDEVAEQLRADPAWPPKQPQPVSGGAKLLRPAAYSQLH